MLCMKEEKSRRITSVTKESSREGWLSKPSSSSSWAHEDRSYFPAFSEGRCGQVANGKNWHGSLKTSHPRPFMLFPLLWACLRNMCNDLESHVLKMAEPQDGRSLSLWILPLRRVFHWSGALILNSTWLRNFYQVRLLRIVGFVTTASLS